MSAIKEKFSDVFPDYDDFGMVAYFKFGKNALPVGIDLEDETLASIDKLRGNIESIQVRVTDPELTFIYVPTDGDKTSWSLKEVKVEKAGETLSFKLEEYGKI